MKTKKVRTEEEKKKVINALKEERERLPKYSLFGDNNHKRIDNQIEAINGKFNSEDQIWDLGLSDSEMTDDIRGEVIGAFNWVNGEDNDFDESYNQ